MMIKFEDYKNKLRVGDVLCWGRYHQFKVEVASTSPLKITNQMKNYKKEPYTPQPGSFDGKILCIIRDGKKIGIKDFIMKNESIKKLENIVERVIRRKLNESFNPLIFKDVREAMFAIDQIEDDNIDPNNFMSKLLKSNEAGTIDNRDLTLLAGQFAMMVKRNNFKLDSNSEWLMNKYVKRTSNGVFNESKKINESYDAYKKNILNQLIDIDFDVFGGDIAYSDVLNTLLSQNKNKIKLSLKEFPTSIPLFAHDKQTYEIELKKLKQLFVKVINGNFDKYNESYESSMSALTRKEDEALKKMKGNDYQELADFVNKKNNVNIGKNWFIGTNFWEFPSDAQYPIRQFLKNKGYLIESTLTESSKFAKGDKVKIVAKNHPWNGKIKTVMSVTEKKPGLKQSSYLVGTNSDAKSFGESDLRIANINENPVPQPAPVAPAAPAPTPAPQPQPAGIDPAWKLDMIEFLGNTFQGFAKQFLYQAKKVNPNATPDQIKAMSVELHKENKINQLFKDRFIGTLSSAL